MNFLRKEKSLALLSLILVFMALLRTIAECLWLGVWITVPAPVHQLEPFLYGALSAAVFCFAMSVLAFYGRYKPVIVLAVPAIACLVAIKLYYHI